MRNKTIKRKTGIMLPKTKKPLLKTILFAMIAGLTIIPVYHVTKVNADVQPSVKIISPATSSLTQGKVALSFKVDGLSSDRYEPFWAVDDGQWNRMSITNGVSIDVIDTTGWNWKTDNSYTFSFIALKKENWQPIIEKRTITINPQVPITVAEPAVTIPAQLPVNTAPVASLYVDPQSDAQLKAKAWALSHPEDSGVLNKLISQPLANWYGGWNQDVAYDVSSYVTRATQAGQIPVLVAYNIPHRDCGSYSAGGVSDKQAYANWIAQFAKGIGNRSAIVLLEPDALAGTDCLSGDAQAERKEMLRSAVKTLKALTGVKVYLDAGHPEWHGTNLMATRLKQAGVEEADGFSLNVSNFVSTDKNIAYGTELSARTNNAHFVIDTSRNGSGSAPNNEWCNPSGVRVGVNPTLVTGNTLVDAYLWVKAPGGSDGTCGSNQRGTNAPAAGEWWPQYALSVLR